MVDVIGFPAHGWSCDLVDLAHLLPAAAVFLELGFWDLAKSRLTNVLSRLQTASGCPSVILATGYNINRRTCAVLLSYPKMCVELRAKYDCMYFSLSN